MLRLSVPSLRCRVPVDVDRGGASRINWTVPSPPEQREKLDAWCGSAGPPVIRARPAAAAPAVVVARQFVAQTGEPDELVVVTWNVHAGTGDVVELVRRLRDGRLTGGRPATHFVLLLQEAMRKGPDVPNVVHPGVRPPKAAGLGARQIDIVEVSRLLGLSLYYVPSMRNGAPPHTDQDRGNAILSSEPLRDFSAIELPFERQRRVAVQATVSGGSSRGGRWQMRMVSAHLESTVPANRLWVLASGARVRQAHGLIEALAPNEPLVLSGDFNTWFGFADPTYRTIAAVIPGIAANERRPTYRPFFRLDHVFARLPVGWTVSAHRLDDRLGSDHYPIVARLVYRGASDIIQAN